MVEAAIGGHRVEAESEVITVPAPHEQHGLLGARAVCAKFIPYNSANLHLPRPIEPLTLPKLFEWNETHQPTQKRLSPDLKGESCYHQRAHLLGMGVGPRSLVEMCIICKAD